MNLIENQWVDQEREFYNQLIQEWLYNNDILTYSTYNILLKGL